MPPVNQAQYGDILYVRTTEEPILVLRQFRRFTLVRRPTTTKHGILKYKLALFLNAELETLNEQTTRTLANIKLRNALSMEEFDSVVGPLQAQFPTDKKPS